MTSDFLAASPVADLETAPNRAAEVYEQLRRAIVEGRIRPNERLVEADLAKRLNVSRTPVRESMPQLVADGLVVSLRRGWVVREHSLPEIQDIFEVRAALEGYAARLAAERATDAQIDDIVRIHESYVTARQESTRGHLIAHNDDFHNAVIAASGNARLAEQIQRNSDFYFVHRIGGFLSDDDVRTSIAGHQQLVDALVARDPERAEDVARFCVLEGLAKNLLRIR